MLNVLTRIQALLRRRRIEAEVAEEIETHRVLTERRLRDSGVSPAGAAVESRRLMGNTTLAVEDARAVWTWSWLEGVRQDMRYAMRNLRRQPGFALLALATLGSAIGINTSLFTAFNALFLRPWPVADASNVFEVKVTYGGNVASQNEEFTVLEYRHLREHARSLSGLVASACIDDREPQCRVKFDREPVGTLFVSRNYFNVLGVPLERGPGLDGPEEKADAVAVISHGLWQRRFGGDPSAIGKTIPINDAPFTIVGVTARDFTGTSFGRKDVWIPLAAKTLVHPEETGEVAVRLAGRLVAGASRAQATSELDVLRRQLRSGPARSNDPNNLGRIVLDHTSFNPNPGKTRPAFQVFGVLALGSFLVLVLACANVGNLLLARGASRGRELAVRLSLGAGPRRVLRQLLTESLVLSGLAAAIGLGIAYVVPPMFVDWVYTQFSGFGSRPFAVYPDISVLAWTVGLIVVSCIAFGLAPAVQTVRETTAAILKRNAPTAGSRLRLRNLLLGAQVVVSVILLTGAALLVRSAQFAADFDLGFVTDNVAAVSFDLPVSYQPAARAAFAHRLVDGLTDLVESKTVSLVTSVPFGSSPARVNYHPHGDALDQPAEGPVVTGGYFDVLGIPAVAGRTFNGADAGRNVVIIDEPLAARLWPQQSPLGSVLVVNGVPQEIVGVVRAADTSGRVFRGRPLLSAIYRPLGHRSIGDGNVPQVLVKGMGAAAVADLAARASRIDSQVEIQTTPLEDNIDRQLAGSRMGAVIAAVLGLVAITFASIGVFGVYAYIVQQRTREIGVRVALGAQPSEVIRFVLRSGSRSLLAGLVLGFAGAAAASKILESSLFGISRLDPVAYAGVAMVLGLAGMVALYLPASRAARVDPVIALRDE
jgi:predicted permease